METDWQTPHRTALGEHDPAKLRHLCEQARYAINTRLLELAKHPALASELEAKELEEALREITLHESRQDPQI
jgi:hypothetical protein